MDDLRSGHAPQLTGDARRRQARAGPQQRHADAGVPRRDGVRRPAHDVVDHRHRRSAPRGEPARADHRARVARERESDGGVGPDASRSPGRVFGGPAGWKADRRAARRPPAAAAARRRGPLRPGHGRRGAARRRRRRRAPRSAGAAGRARRPGRRALSGAGAVHRKRRAGDRRRSRGRGPRRHRHSRARGAADAVRQRAAREEADHQPAVGARGAAHQGRRLQRAHGALRRDGARAGASGAHRRRDGVHPRRVLLPRVAGGVHRRTLRPAQGGRRPGCGCRSIRRSISFPPTRRTSVSPAAASTSRPRFCP